MSPAQPDPLPKDMLSPADDTVPRGPSDDHSAKDPRFMGGIVVVFRKNDPHKTISRKDGCRGQAGGVPVETLPDPAEKW